jgi:putative transposase
MKYYKNNRKKYYLQTHLVFVVKYRKKILQHNIDKRVKDTMFDIANANNWQINAIETDKYHIHILLAYSLDERVCDIVKTLKQKTTHEVWSHHERYLSKCFWKRKIFWSDGYFCCSVGDASTETIENYIASQG